MDIIDDTNLEIWRLSNGDVFKYANCVYIKTTIKGCDSNVYNAVNLKNGSIEVFDNDFIVERVQAELTIF